jgi:hypothetical protein
MACLKGAVLFKIAAVSIDDARLGGRHWTCMCTIGNEVLVAQLKVQYVLLEIAGMKVTVVFVKRTRRYE